MASESSSAMLDLNDADTEDTEAPSVTDVSCRDSVPLMMETGYDIAVKVDAPMKQLSTLETFVTYRVRCVCARWATPYCVRRRYNHFKLLHKRLAASQPWLAPPPPPPLHTARQQLDRYSASFVAVRTMALHAFLDRIAKHPIFTHSEDFRIFLTTPDEEFDKVFRSENSALNLWGLSSALYGTNDSKPTNGARVKDPEWCSQVEYLSSLQQKLSTLSALTSRLQRGSADLALEMINMKRTCDAWSSQARGSTARAAAALAGAAAAAAAAPPAPAPRAAPAHRAVLPLLASYTAAHVEKIKQRDALHAAHVAGASTAGDMHNKLEQASEALRSELADWLPKTRADVKDALLQLARGQLARQARALAAWQRALQLASAPSPARSPSPSPSPAAPSTPAADVARLFKTVSRAAVRNLSPCSPATLARTEAERDLDDLADCSSDDDAPVDRKNFTDRIEVDRNVAVEGVERAESGEDLASEVFDSGKVRTDSSERSSKSDVVSDPLREFSEIDLRDAPSDLNLNE